jgi:hypothetical protein
LPREKHWDVTSRLRAGKPQHIKSSPKTPRQNQPRCLQADSHLSAPTDTFAESSFPLLLLTHGLVSFKLLHGLCRYALSAFVPPSVIPNLHKNSWRGQAIKQICE